MQLLLLMKRKKGKERNIDGVLSFIELYKKGQKGSLTHSLSISTLPTATSPWLSITSKIAPSVEVRLKQS